MNTKRILGIAVVTLLVAVALVGAASATYANISIDTTKMTGGHISNISATGGEFTTDITDATYGGKYTLDDAGNLKIQGSTQAGTLYPVADAGYIFVCWMLMPTNTTSYIYEVIESGKFTQYKNAKIYALFVPVGSMSFSSDDDAIAAGYNVKYMGWYYKTLDAAAVIYNGETLENPITIINSHALAGPLVIRNTPMTISNNDSGDIKTINLNNNRIYIYGDVNFGGDNNVVYTDTLNATSSNDEFFDKVVYVPYGVNTLTNLKLTLTGTSDTTRQGSFLSVNHTLNNTCTISNCTVDASGLTKSNDTSIIAAGLTNNSGNTITLKDSIIKNGSNTGHKSQALVINNTSGNITIDGGSLTDVSTGISNPNRESVCIRVQANSGTGIVTVKNITLTSTAEGTKNVGIAVDGSANASSIGNVENSSVVLNTVNFVLPTDGYALWKEDSKVSTKFTLDADSKVNGTAISTTNPFNVKFQDCSYDTTEDYVGAVDSLDVAGVNIYVGPSTKTDKSYKLTNTTYNNAVTSAGTNGSVYIYSLSATSELTTTDAKLANVMDHVLSAKTGAKIVTETKTVEFIKDFASPHDIESCIKVYDNAEKGTDVSLTIGLTYTFTIPASAQLSTVKGNYVYYDVGINAEVREANNKLVIRLNSEADSKATEASGIDEFKVEGNNLEANYQVGKAVSPFGSTDFTPIGGKDTVMTAGNELISLDMDNYSSVSGYVGFKTITLPSFAGTYTDTLNFKIAEETK